MKLEQVLQNIKNSQGGAIGKDDSIKRRQAALTATATEQRIRDNRSPYGTEVNRDTSIFTPKGLEEAKRVSAMRNVKNFSFSMPVQKQTDLPSTQVSTGIDTGAGGGGSSVDNVPGPMETVTPDDLIKLEEESKAWFAPKEKQDKFKAALAAYAAEVGKQDTSTFDKVRSGEVINWRDLAKIRQYLTSDEAKAAMEPYEEQRRNENAMGRRIDLTEEKNMRRVLDANDAREKAAGAYSKTIPGQDDLNTGSEAKITRSISDAVANIRGIKNNEALREEQVDKTLKSIETMVKGNMLRGTPEEVSKEIARRQKDFMDEVYKKGK